MEMELTVPSGKVLLANKGKKVMVIFFLVALKVQLKHHQLYEVVPDPSATCDFLPKITLYLFCT